MRSISSTLLAAALAMACGGSPPIDHAGWVRAAPAGRYFSVDGAPFLVTGNQPGTGFLDLSDADIEAHLTRMESFGETVARLDFDYAWDKEPLTGAPARYVGLETSVGVFDEARAARIDAVFALAGRHGIRILVVPFVTSPPMWSTWPLNPYSTAQGGPAADPYDFMVSRQARAAYCRRLEWIAERWGGSGTFFGWDLMNEADVLMTDHADGPAQLDGWVRELGQCVAAKEQQLFGQEHVRVVSWSETLPGDDEHFLVDSPALNAAATHPYELYGTTFSSWPNVVTRFVPPVLGVHAKLLTLVGKRVRDRRPYFENEHHQNDQPMLSFFREADHQLAWAELMSGASGTGITWLIEPAPQPQPLHRTLGERHEALGPGRRVLADFTHHRVPPELFLAGTTDEAADALASADPALDVLSVRRGSVAMAWLVASDDRCLRAQSVAEIRALRAAGNPYNVWEGGLAALLWSQLMSGAGLTVDSSLANGLVQAAKDKDSAAAVTAVEQLLGALEADAAATQLLDGLSSCATLTPALQLHMPAGRYRIDWVDDVTGELVRADASVPGDAAVSAPAFVSHLAAVIAKETP